MPTKEHDVLAELFRWRPELAADLVSDLGVALPDVRGAVPCSESFTDLKTSEYTGDSTVLLELDAGMFGVVVEIQRARDDDKPWTWPLYLATFRARQRCPAVLLVIAPDPKVAEWCATPIETGHPGHTLTPMVLQPGSCARYDRPEGIRRGPAHGNAVDDVPWHRPEGMKVLHAASVGTDIIAETDRRIARRYIDCALAVLPEAARKTLETIMQTESDFYSETFRGAEAKGRSEGKTEGEVRSLLTILDARGIALTDEQRTLINDTTDLERLQGWMRRAATSDSADQVFA